MAKKLAYVKLGMECTVCGSRNYLTGKNKLENKDKITLNKFCNRCKKHTPHKETEKLK